MTRWTPEMQKWLEETMSRSKPLSVRQLDVVRTAFRKAAVSDLPQPAPRGRVTAA